MQARVRLSEEVSQADVEEAIRLMERSKMSLYESRQRKRTVDPVSAIYNIVRDAIVAKDLHEIRYVAIFTCINSVGLYAPHNLFSFCTGMQIYYQLCCLKDSAKSS